MDRFDYARDKDVVEKFLHYFTDAEGSPKYMKQLVEIVKRNSCLLEVDLEDIHKSVEERPELLELLDNIEGNTKRYMEIFSEAADHLMQNPVLFPPSHVAPPATDVIDVLRLQWEAKRREREEREPQPAEQQDPDNRIDFPPELMRRYDVVFAPRELHKLLKLREVAAPHIGKLVRVQGVVTHVSDVKPLMSVATYIDDASGCEIFQLVRGMTFQPVTEVPREVKERGGGKEAPRLQTHGSKFVAFQEIKVQEVSTEVPQGSTPRGISVQLRGAVTRCCKPGDAIELSGIWLPEPVQRGYRGRKGSPLVSTSFLEGMCVKQLKQSYQDHEHDAELQQRVTETAAEHDVYDRLSSSLAPEIFGHEDVKKVLLLLMVGAPTKTLGDGVKLRGDIHVCLMGDPGVAKSQMIKHIAHIAPRAVYTTGKGTSGAGLTAAVQRDQLTGEMVLEGGALCLADKGICCIDEFDKMDETDRTNIHEVMEQQTISIAKAGISTTLNARTCVLAAANPAWGRYDTRRSPAENINLPPALLSRFDVMWLLLDKPDPEQDRRLAEHVMKVHRDGHPPVREGLDLFPAELLRAYVAHAKTYEPHVPVELTGICAFVEYIAVVYAELRQEEASSKMPHSYTTARTLMSILRLSQALARLRFSQIVLQNDIDEALRLMRMSKTSLLDSNRTAVVDPTTAIFAVIRDETERSNKRVFTWSELVALLGRSYGNEQIKTAVEEYADYHVFHLDYPEPGEPTVHVLSSEV